MPKVVSAQDLILTRDVSLRLCALRFSVGPRSMSKDCWLEIWCDLNHIEKINLSLLIVN